MVLNACPGIAEHAPNGVNSWRDLMAAAALVCAWLGISPSAWRRPSRRSAPRRGRHPCRNPAARLLINSAGGYLRNLTDKARAGAFSLGLMLMALIRANLGKGTKKCERYFVFAPEPASIDPQDHRQNGQKRPLD